MIVKLWKLQDERKEKKGKERKGKEERKLLDLCEIGGREDRFEDA